MKKSLSILIAILAFLPLYAQPTGYVAYWPFDGNAQDQSGNLNHGTVSGATLTTDRDGATNSAYYFDGVDDYIVIPNAPELQFGESSFSVALWIYPEDCNNVRFINNRGTGLWGNYPGYQVKAWENGSNWYFGDAGINDANQNYIKCVGCGSEYPLNNWHHIAMVYEADNQLKLYVNGVLDGTVSTGPFGDITNSLPTAIGAAVADEGTYNPSSPALTQLFRGKIDEVYLYNRALTSGEVAELYQPGSGSGGSTVWQENGNHIYFNTGNVAINTTSVPNGYVFGVDGKMITKEVKVSLTGWADHVFDAEYPLLPMEKLEQFIQRNHHLPGIPAEKEVTEYGIHLGEMNAKLLEKTEELTLYLLEMKKEIDWLKRENVLLREKLEGN
jgi:hypothetical protein